VNRQQINPRFLYLVGGAILTVAFFGFCVLGGSGSDDDSPGGLPRSGSAPTATPPANLPEPILVGQTQASTNTTATSGSGGSTYIIESGDTLGAIASRLGVPPDQQAAWVAQVLQLNGIADARLLAVGVEIRLPRTPGTTGTPAPAATPRPGTTPSAQATTAPTVQPTPAAGGSGTYTVRSGDYPQLIGRNLCVPESRLAAWADQLVSINGVTASGLSIGQVLTLPPDTPGC
jgi:LysM repeat protein